MKILLSSLLFCFFIIGEHYGQSCGTKYTTPPRGWLQQVQQKQLYTRSSNQAIEILLKIHIVRRSDGSGGISAEEILAGVENANTHYQQAMDLTFKICPDIHYIDNTTLYTSEVDSIVLNDFFFPSRVSYAIDVFYAPITNPTTDGFIASWAYFPWMTGDCIIMHNAMSTGNTLAHEIGHYLGLLHTHERTYLLADGIPNNHDANAVEYVDGTGCTTRGDGMCDTPADHGLGGRVSSDGQGNNCTYSGNPFYDLNGDLFVPNIFNVMSYTNDDCRNVFSEDQAQRMLTVLQNDRAAIYAHRNQPCPCENEPNSWIFEEVDYVGCKENISIWATITNLSTVAANQVINAKNIVSSNANVSYQAGQSIHLEPGFKIELGGIFKTQMQGCSFASCTSSSATYVSPMHGHSGMPTVELSTEIDAEPSTTNKLQCFPNPANHRLDVLFDLENLGDVTIQLVDVNGRIIVQLEEQNLSSGQQYYQLNTQDLTSGVYMMVVQMQDRIATKKVLIQH